MSHYQICLETMEYILVTLPTVPTVPNIEERRELVRNLVTEALKVKDLLPGLNKQERIAIEELLSPSWDNLELRVKQLSGDDRLFFDQIERG